MALGQINPTVGDISGNTSKIIRFIKAAAERGADLVVFPELAITGYPPKDLLLKPSFIKDNRDALKQIITASEGIAVVTGFVDADKKKLYNAAALIKERELIGIQHKMHLPSCDVFDEKRYFEPATKIEIFDLGKIKLGLNICEDIWVEHGPYEVQAAKGADLIVNISASPFYTGKTKVRRELISKRARENEVWLLYLNLVGGQDDLIFDGRSSIVNREGKLIAECKSFEEDLPVIDLDHEVITPEEEEGISEIYSALVLGVRDYIQKNGFSKVVIGLSGGIDSAVTAALARDALGSRNVIGVSMPSAITSRQSIDDAEKLACNLDIDFKVIPIAKIVDAYTETLSEEFKGREVDATEENIQARIRGNILMALSNKFGYFVLSTGNKSELAVGYCTLYGDMAGGLAVLSDVLKTTVYELARYINQINESEIIPEGIITKEPSAELREGQKDADSLPPYSVLDPILRAYIEEQRSREEIVSQGFDDEIVADIIFRVDHNEYKRQQMALGIKITPLAFGSGRRMPITNRYSG
ncbi:MAG: NAD+ synthetase [Candidatus Syntrophoarchaeum caldarius]|uniref:Glutamine-dependent NAD(+) synthetase n=1 Tax=Candidatus Syntropharchaeum caldarium TaxID=1838285 RepID=A0A1F2P7H6_9EURY|nr:MAG: NAD+ synthetase [Candidatus Syntrophoarchaeum caldarius]